jgi:glycogen operon protein
VLLGGADVDWTTFDGREFDGEDWHDPKTAAIVMLLHLPEQPQRIAIAFNRTDDTIELALPARTGHRWHRVDTDCATLAIDPRSVGYVVEEEDR